MVPLLGLLLGMGPESRAALRFPVLEANEILNTAYPAQQPGAAVLIAQGDQVLNLDKTKDYNVVLGAAPHVGAVSIVGGRNVVLKGGTIGIPATSAKNTALIIKDSIVMLITKLNTFERANMTNLLCL